jgi:site-specific recombinase XerD
MEQHQFWSSECRIALSIVFRHFSDIELSCSRSHECIVQNMRVASVRAARRKLVKLFRKQNSRYYWYDFTVRGRRYRGSTQETRSVRAQKTASLKLALIVENADVLPRKPTNLGRFAERFLAWVDDGRLEEKTKKFYRNGWRLLKATHVAGIQVDEITGDCAEQLKFPGSAANANCALRTLRRMLHKAEEWKMIGHAPKIKMLKEHGRHLRLDDEAERKLIAGAWACNWRVRTRELFRDIVILMRDTGMRNERELFKMRIENLDWQNRVIFVPDSKTAEGRRLVPMSGRVFEILQNRCNGTEGGWVFPSKRSASGHLRSICNLFRKARIKAGLQKELVLYCARHDYGTRVLIRTGNLAAVMRTMGHRDVKTAMHYQHPELEIVRAALDYRPPSTEVVS